MEIKGTGDKAVDRTVDDLVDDWHRQSGHLTVEDVTRLTSKRQLDGDQIALVLIELEAQEVVVAGHGLAGVTELETGTRPRFVQSAPAGSADIVRDYLQSIAKYNLIFAEDEVRLGRMIQAGLIAAEAIKNLKPGTIEARQQLRRLSEIRAAGRRAHHELVCANLRLVVSIAKLGRYQLSSVEFIDRVQDGNIGLMRAADKFDPEKGFKFSTYATWWIRQSIERAIGDRGRAIRIPIHMLEKINKVSKGRRRLEGRLGRVPTLEELAEEVAMSTAEAQAITDTDTRMVSLDAPVGDNLAFGDLLGDDRRGVDALVDPAATIDIDAFVRDFHATLCAVLSDREMTIMTQRHGLDGEEPETLEVIGQRLGVTRERIRQIESKTMKKLRGKQCVRDLRAYLVEGDSEPPPKTQTRTVASRPAPVPKSRGKRTLGGVPAPVTSSRSPIVDLQRKPLIPFPTVESEIFGPHDADRAEADR